MEVARWLELAAAELRRAGHRDAERDAALILGASLGVHPAQLAERARQPVPDDAADAAALRLRRRLDGGRSAYADGVVEFRGVELLVDPRVYIPRASVMVDVACELPAGARLHEVGTGCGAIALAVKHARPDLRVSASDISPDAIDVARANAERLGLEVELAVADGVPPGEFDLVIANMPYVLPDDPRVDTEFAGEPFAAVICPTGERTELIRHVIATAPPGTRLALQHAQADAEEIAALLDDTTTRLVPGGPAVTWGTARGAPVTAAR